MTVNEEGGGGKKVYCLSTRYARKYSGIDFYTVTLFL